MGLESEPLGDLPLARWGKFKMAWFLGFIGDPTRKATTSEAASAADGEKKARLAPRPQLVDRRNWLALIGFGVLHFSHPWTWQLPAPAIWFPPAAVGFLLLAWLGWPAFVLILLDSLLVTFQAWATGTPLPGGGSFPALAAGLWVSLLGAFEVWLAWWFYQRLEPDERRLLDPRAATYFLILVPGFTVGITAVLSGLPLVSLGAGPFWQWTSAYWLSHALAIFTVVPISLALATPSLARWGLLGSARPILERNRGLLPPMTLGDGLEIYGLSLGTAILGLLLVGAHRQEGVVGWQYWVLPLLLIVWASLRQGLRGGLIAATTTAVLSLTMVSWIGSQQLVVAPLQGYLLAQCSTALLVGISFSWIRASESRYRQVVDHMPVVLYSARVHGVGRWPIAPENIEITFASPASRQLFGTAPEELLRDYELWLQHVHPDDRELVRAAILQLSLHKQPVTHEYRLNQCGASSRSSLLQGQGEAKPSPSGPGLEKVRWVRDTLVPLLDAQGTLRGWEGVVVDITEQRLTSDDLRRTTGMLHALVTNLPAGIFFVHAPSGQPILVNARARELLGQHEDLAAGLAHWPRVYRLFRPDGTTYPPDELPVYTALRLGRTSMRDDIVVHRPDGRRLSLVSWAAPIHIRGEGRPDAAVWVLEDLSRLHGLPARK
jgi:PAS domain-containing protein